VIKIKIKLTLIIRVIEEKFLKYEYQAKGEIAVSFGQNRF